MVIKYVNPIFNMPHITEFTDAYISHDLDDDGNETSEYVLMINCDNEYEYCLCVKGASFSRLNELMNDLYDNEKIDLSTDSNIEIFAFPKAFEGVSMGDLFDGDDLPEGLSREDFDDFMDEEYYND